MAVLKFGPSRLRTYKSEHTRTRARTQFRKKMRMGEQGEFDKVYR
jgi:hypothetical protein